MFKNTFFIGHLKATDSNSSNQEHKNTSKYYNKDTKMTSIETILMTL